MYGSFPPRCRTSDTQGMQRETQMLQAFLVISTKQQTNDISSNRNAISSENGRLRLCIHVVPIGSLVFPFWDYLMGF